MQVCTVSGIPPVMLVTLGVPASTFELIEKLLRDTALEPMADRAGLFPCAAEGV